MVLTTVSNGAKSASLTFANHHSRCCSAVSSPPSSKMSNVCSFSSADTLGTTAYSPPLTWFNVSRDASFNSAAFTISESKTFLIEFLSRCCVCMLELMLAFGAPHGKPIATDWAIGSRTRYTVQYSHHPVLLFAEIASLEASFVQREYNSPIC
jgi:hypothetical protein